MRKIETKRRSRLAMRRRKGESVLIGEAIVTVRSANDQRLRLSVESATERKTLTCRRGDEFHIGDCTVQITQTGSNASLLIIAPRDVQIVRGEILIREAAAGRLHFNLDIASLA